jgi:histidyl-tRNA synthetase
VLVMLVAFLSSLGFEDLGVLINTVGDGASRAAYRERLVAFLEPLADRLGEDSRRRLTTNPLRILDSKSPEEQALLAGAPKLEDSLSESSRAHFARVRELLTAFGLDYRVDPRLVRGLDYYTNTVFEIVSEGLGAQNAICGGGAYEGLVEELGGKPTYGVGFAIGQDRLIEVLPADSPQRRLAPGPVVIRVVAPASTDRETLETAALALAEELRGLGMPAVSLGAAAARTAFAQAEMLSSPAIALLGEDEHRSGQLTVRATANREQQTLPRAQAISYLKSLYPLLLSANLIPEAQA